MLLPKAKNKDPQETDVWACLWGSLQAGLSEIGRPTLMQRAPSPGEGELSTCPIPLCFLTEITK